MSDSKGSASGAGGGCPVDHSAMKTQVADIHMSQAPHGSGCPVDHGQKSRLPTFAQSLFGSSTDESQQQHQESRPSSSESKCPVNHGNSAQSEVNPLNMMPNLTQEMHEGQTSKLSVERELSSIPRATGSSDPNDSYGGNGQVWEYPSPQQFYNALARKNMEAPEEYMDIMVDIHNFLNEGAWNEVLKWESRHKDRCLNPKLLRLQGRPRDLSPLARITSWIHGVRPFDRHDWYVDRCGKQVRYVIDYYEGIPENDMPVFNLVVRPAIDDFESLTDRARQLWQDAKEKYFGSEQK
ncbi:holocytochrome c synthase [Dipsacomyces acuminosporus]|nr:holocytochrome c synthase [Dipsacomyces acuminosporus]